MRVKNMVKNKDWNMAFSDDQDTKALMSSEVFRNLLSMHKQQKIAKQRMIDALPPPVFPDFNDELRKEAQESESSESANDSAEDSNDEDNYDYEEKDEDDSEPEEKEEKESAPKSTPTAPKAKSNDNEDLYDTGAGDSSHIDIGITTETEKMMLDGIDYVKYDAVSIKTDKKAPAVKKEKSSDEDDETKEAEKDLGLDKNAFYIYRKMMAKRA